MWLKFIHVKKCIFCKISIHNEVGKHKYKDIKKCEKRYSILLTDFTKESLVDRSSELKDPYSDLIAYVWGVILKKTSIW